MRFTSQINILATAKSQICMKKFLLPFLGAVFISCSDESVAPDIGAQIEDRQIVLGEKLPNPYSLSVMQKAADELADGGSLKAAVILRPTHYYLRFAPRDTAEIDLLEADTTVFFYNYPMPGGRHIHRPERSRRDSQVYVLRRRGRPQDARRAVRSA